MWPSLSFSSLHSLAAILFPVFSSQVGFLPLRRLERGNWAQEPLDNCAKSRSRVLASFEVSGTWTASREPGSEVYLCGMQGAKLSRDLCGMQGAKLPQGSQGSLAIRCLGKAGELWAVQGCHRGAPFQSVPSPGRDPAQEISLRGLGASPCGTIQG